MFSGRHHDDPGVDDLRDALAAEVGDHGLDAEVAHLHRVLEDEAEDVAVPEPLDELGRAVEADELHLAGEPGFLEGPQDAEGARLVGGEDALDVREPADAGSPRAGRRVSVVAPAYWSWTRRSRPGNSFFTVSRKPASLWVVLAEPSW